jgi:hypothetical protein
MCPFRATNQSQNDRFFYSAIYLTKDETTICGVLFPSPPG